MWKKDRNRKTNNIDDSINELLDAWMDMLSISLPMANMNDWVEMPSKTKKANPMSYEDRDKDIVFTIDMPGVQKKDIDINIDEHSIRVSAENDKGRNYNYTRRFKPTVDASSAVATFTNGVLDITVKKVEEKDKGTKVKIK
jgi:HSP20 family molecular chaperone IbpA|tara:strand:- start:1692 stop:2114 length:423 start_codon:yes stop_codon:yes gene_type:complete